MAKVLPIEKQKGIHAKITTTVKAFVAALKNTHVPRKSTIPVLSYARVQDATLVGTDLDVTTIVPFEGKGKGDFLIPHKQTLDVLTGETGNLVLEFHDTIGNVKSGKAEEGRRFVKLTVGDINFEFESLSVANFPQIPKQADAVLTIDGAALKTMLERTDFAISNEESRYTLNATLLKASKGKVTMVATNGHRLSHVTGKGTGAIEDTLLLPTATRWVYKNCRGEVSIGLDENTHTIRTESGTILSKKVTGQFPNFEAVMPRGNTIITGFKSAKKFDNILKRIMKCSDERSGAIKLLAGETTTTISASSLERGSAKADVECNTLGLPGKGAALQMGFNGEYISDFLKVIPEGEFTLSLKDAQSAGMLQVDGFKYILMPMRI